MGDQERNWLERELAELRARETRYRERLGRREADAARLRAHANSLHQLLRRTPSVEGPRATLAAVARLSGQALGSERTSVWYFDADQRFLSCEILLVRDVETVAPGGPIVCETCPAYVRALGEDSAVAVNDVYDDPRTQELGPYLRAHGIGALLDIPIVIAGKLLGVVCHEHVGPPRAWGVSEVEFASNVGQLVALTLETERRIRAEFAARGSEARFQYLVESLPVTVYSFDVHTGKLAYVSPRAAELSERTADQWVEEGVGEWVHRIHPEDRAPVRLRFERGADGGFPEEVTYRVRSDDGRIRWVRDTCRVVRDHAGAPLAIQGVLADVTDQAEDKLARLEIERRHRALLENVDIMAVALDAEGRVTFANDAFVRVSGFPRQDLIGLDWFSVVLPPASRDPVRERFLEDVARGEIASRFELGIVTRGGESRQILCANTLLRSPNGQGEGTLSLALDVTARRALENELVQQTKLESLNRLAAGVAHDFNNLLTVMVGQVLLLKRCGVTALTPSAAEPIVALEVAIEQATELARSLLLYGRKHPAQREVFSIDELVRLTMPLLEALVGRKRMLSVALHAPGAQILFDRARVRQVLLNLVGNAVDAIAGADRAIRLRTHVELVDDAQARTHGASGGGEFIVLTVADDGPGMDARMLTRIFDPFFTTKSEGRGTGLGLAITQTVAGEAGGFVQVESDTGKGTEFRVYLPRYAPHQEGSEPPPRSTGAPRSGARARVLVVEDESRIRQLIIEILRGAGYEVLGVGDTRAAAEILGSSSIDLLLTDLHLPDGSGAVLARSARSTRPNLRVITMSGSSVDEPFDGALPKPFDGETILRVVGDALAAPLSGPTSYRGS